MGELFRRRVGGERFGEEVYDGVGSRGLETGGIDHGDRASIVYELLGP